MGNKTSQLQIRVSPEQKRRLKALAAAAGLNVSQYVLSTVLPVAQERGPLAQEEHEDRARVPEAADERRVPVVEAEDKGRAPVVEGEGEGRAPVVGAEDEGQAPVVGASTRRSGVPGPDELERRVIARADAHRSRVFDLVEDLAGGQDRWRGLQQLGEHLVRLAPSDLQGAVDELVLEAVPAVLRNHIAALVELTTRSVGLDPPGWVAQVEPLPLPHYGRPLASLQPHQLRVTPTPFKRRNVFLDTEATPVLQSGRHPVRPGTHFARVGARLVSLNAELRRAGIHGELCTIGGKLVAIGYAAAPETRSVRALFRAPADLREAIVAATHGSGGSGTWLAEIAQQAREADRHVSSPFVDLSNLRLYPGRPDYLLAVCCASLRLGRDAPTERAIAFLLGYLGLDDPRGALDVVERYFAPHHLPPQLPGTLDELLGDATP